MPDTWATRSCGRIPESSRRSICETVRRISSRTFDEATAEAGSGVPSINLVRNWAASPPSSRASRPATINPAQYWDREHESGNREAFAMVAATRLMWALGFVAVPALPMNVQCQDCPEDPHTGSGPRALRRYVAMWQLSVSGPPIVSGTDDDQVGSGRNWTTRSTSCRPVRSETAASGLRRPRALRRARSARRPEEPSNRPCGVWTMWT